MSIWTPSGQVTGLWVSQDGVKKEVQSGWCSQGGVAVPFYRKGGGKMFIFVSSYSGSGGSLLIWRSANLTDWASINLFDQIGEEYASYSLCGYTFFNGQFIVALSSGTDNVFFGSENGSKWGKLFEFTTAAALSSIRVANGKLFLLCKGTTHYHTEDLVSFSSFTLSQGNTNFYPVTVGYNESSGYYYIGLTYGFMFYTKNLSSFSRITPTNTSTYTDSHYYDRFIYDDASGYLWIGNTRGLYYASESSYTVTSVYSSSSPSSDYAHHGCCKSADRILFMYDTGTSPYICTIVKGAATRETYKNIDSNLTVVKGAHRLLRANGKFILFGNEYFKTSEDGLTWEDLQVDADILSNFSSGAFLFSAQGGSEDV